MDRYQYSTVLLVHLTEWNWITELENVCTSVLDLYLNTPPVREPFVRGLTFGTPCISSGDQVKEIVMGGAFDMYGGEILTNSLVGTPERKEPPGRSRHRREDNVAVDL